MTKQITDTIMMIRPVAFHLNEQTAVNNHYQQTLPGLTENQIREKAVEEFDALVEILRANGVHVKIFRDTPDPPTPDAIFPNNWISFHEDGTIRLYPMYAENRRRERRADVLDTFKSEYRVSTVERYTEWESENAFLEGTGSLVLDRQHKIAYASISERTMPNVLEDFCNRTGYTSVSFHANQTVGDRRLPIYHTNVMMSLGERFAVVCMESIDDATERKELKARLDETGKELIETTERQKDRFSGNMLQVTGVDSRRLVVMSSSAYHALDEDRIKRMEVHGKIVHSDVNTIETLGGGSVRCMMAEVFLPEK